MIIREKHTGDAGYCVISRRLAQEARLSPGAKTLLIYMLSFPDNWEHTVKALSEGRNETPENIKRHLAELERYGYYHVDFKADVEGHKIPIGQVVSEYPMGRQ